MTNPRVAISLIGGLEKAEALIIFNSFCRLKIEVYLLACQTRLS